MKLVGGVTAISAHTSEASTTPLWLLDVDGVLNAIEPKNKHRNAWGRYEKQRVDGGFEITWAPALITGIREMIEDGLVEVQWLTTWMHLANGGLRVLLDLPELPVAATMDEFRRGNHTVDWWKLAAAKRVAGQRPLIWTDDDLAGSDDARLWVTERPWPTLAICPSYRGGLQPEEFQKIYDFAISARARTADVG